MSPRLSAGGPREICMLDSLLYAKSLQVYLFRSIIKMNLLLYNLVTLNLHSELCRSSHEVLECVWFILRTSRALKMRTWFGVKQAHGPDLFHINIPLGQPPFIFSMANRSMCFKKFWYQKGGNYFLSWLIDWIDLWNYWTYNRKPYWLREVFFLPTDCTKWLVFRYKSK